MKKFVKYAFFSAVLLISGIIILLMYVSANHNDIVNYISEKNANKSSFILIGNAPFAQFKVGNRTGTALVDTGSTISGIDVSKLESRYYSSAGSINVTSVFNTSDQNLYLLSSLKVLGREITDVLVTSSGSDGLNIIGSPEIFSRDKLFLTKHNIYYDDKAAIEVLNRNKIPVVVIRDRDNTGKTSAVYLKLNINGIDELVLLDTGLSTLLTATNADLKSGNKSFLPSVRLLRTYNDTTIKTSYSYDAVIKIGTNEIISDYDVIENFIKPRARFYLGPKIFDYYAIYFDFGKKEFYFVDINS